MKPHGSLALHVMIAFSLVGCAKAGNTDGYPDTFTDGTDTYGTDTAVDGTDTGGDASCAAGLTDCDGECVDLMTDAYHCGSCEDACTTPGVNMEAGCMSGSCAFTCADGYWDADGEPGCEYPCTFTSGTETCNGVDDNCDGNADEGFPCSFGVETACTTVCLTLGSGTCGTHCEIPAPEDCTPPAELCNGIDDDCDDVTDEDWPPGTCGECVPDCTGRECGMEPVCYTSCGTCDVTSEICDSSGTCVCVPSCVGRECGPDPVCGTPCGTCTFPETCDATGHCVSSCTPNCTGRVCGPDPVCGESCGTCTLPAVCNAAGACVCTPDCSGRECGLDPVCSTSCGSCVLPETCDTTGHCVGGCTPTTEVCNGLDDDCDSVADNGAGMQCVRSTTGIFCITGGGEAGTQDCSASCILSACCASTETCDNGFDDDCDGFDDTTDTDCPVGPGTTCADAIDVTSLASWSGAFADFPDYWYGGFACGYASGPEVWFEATVPAGYVFTATETSASNVVIERVANCSASTCLDYTDSPETLEYRNATSSPVHVVIIVERYSGTTGPVTMTFSIEPPPEGLTCTDAIDATSLSSWGGSLGDYDDIWYGGFACGYANGREVWFSADVAAGDIFTIDETTSVDTVVQRVASCSATTCLEYRDSPESLEFYNDTGSTQTVYYIVEAYSSSSTGTIDVDFTNSSPPDGYSCADAVDVTAGGSWSGVYADYANDWSGGYSCGYASGREVWFTADVPAGNIFTIAETSGTDVVIESVASCSATTCTDYTDSPETLEWYNDTGSPRTVKVIVEAYSSSSTGAISVTVTNVPPPEGYDCDAAVDVTSLSTWTGSLTVYANLWSGGYSCGYASGSEIWFSATVPAGNLFTFAETTGTDVVIEAVSSCLSTTCLSYSDTPESYTFYNDTGSASTITLIVEGYYSYTSGTVTVNVENAPAPPGYSCTSPVDVTSLTTFTGNFADFPDTWTGGSGCGYASGPEAWFRATVQPGDTFTLAETSTLDVVLERVSSCAATSCVSYTDTPENMSYTNSTGSPVVLYIIVERYYDGTGNFTVNVTNG